MLRSLDPETNFTSPKSKKHRPEGKELQKFSKGELEHIEKEEELDKEVRVNRARRSREETLLLDLAERIESEKK